MHDICIENPRRAVGLPDLKVAAGSSLVLRAGKKNSGPIMIGPTKRSLQRKGTAFQLLPACWIELSVQNANSLFVRGRRGDSLQVREGPL